MITALHFINFCNTEWSGTVGLAAGRVSSPQKMSD